MARPITVSLATSTGHCDMVTTCKCGEYTGYRTAVIAITSTTLIRGGITALPKNGANKTSPDTRVPMTNTEPMICASAISMSSTQIRVKIGQKLQSELAQLLPHPWHQKKHAGRDCQKPGHRRNRGLLKRSQDLYDVDQQAHCHRNCQYRACDHEHLSHG